MILDWFGQISRPVQIQTPFTSTVRSRQQRVPLPKWIHPCKLVSELRANFFWARLCGVGAFVRLEPSPSPSSVLLNGSTALRRCARADSSGSRRAGRYGQSRANRHERDLIQAETVLTLEAYLKSNEAGYHPHARQMFTRHRTALDEQMPRRLFGIIVSIWGLNRTSGSSPASDRLLFWPRWRLPIALPFSAPNCSTDS